MRTQPERCYCGDPECTSCFPYALAADEPDEDEIRQQETDDAMDLRAVIVSIAAADSRQSDE